MNFVCIVFELGDKMLTLSSMENLIVPCNLIDCVYNTSDSASIGLGFEPHSGRRVVSLSKTCPPQKVLVIPRKRWLRPNITEKLFTGTLSIKPNQTFIDS